MTTEERARCEVLLENIQRQVHFLADGHLTLVAGQQAIVERLDRIETRLDGHDHHLGVIDGRLGRIEHQVGLNGSAGKKVTTSKKAKRRSRKPTR